MAVTFPIFGILVPMGFPPVEITTGITLVSGTEAPPSHYKTELIDERAPWQTVEMCALVVEQPEGSYLDRSSELETIRLALVLSSSGFADIGPSYTEHQFYPRERSYLTLFQMVDERMLVDRYCRLRALPDNAFSVALLRAVDRLNRARIYDNLADKMLEYGIALEVALMIGDQGRGEITNKFSSRAAWLLGETLDDRLAVAKTTKLLYQLRSTVVHEGGLKDVPDDDKITHIDDIAGAVLNKLLEAGKAPDWHRLALGDKNS
jgi:hypothetical protein